MSTTAAEKEKLLALLPDRMGDWLALQPGSDPDKLLTAAAEGIAAETATPVEQVQADANPLTATIAGIGDWERVFKDAGGKVATYGSDEGRRAQMLSRFREAGASTLANITAALAAVTGNTTSIEILEHSRADLTVAHEYTNATGAIYFGGGTETQSVSFGDNAPTSQAGARLYFNGLTASDLDDLTITLTGPDATVRTWPDPNDATKGRAELRPIATEPAISLFAPDFAGLPCSGTWTVEVSSVAGDFAWDYWAVIVEGIGRDPLSGADGLGANIFEWAALVDPAQVTPGTFDVELARDIVQRFNPSHARSYLALKNKNGGAAATFDDTNTPFDGGIFA